MKPITRDSLDWEMKLVWDAYFEDGKREGEREAKEKSIKEFYITTAKKLKELSIPIETITEITGLTASEIEEL
jgi:predicted transposase/invertase (TIGR01784 family)